MASFNILRRLVVIHQSRLISTFFSSQSPNIGLPCGTIRTCLQHSCAATFWNKGVYVLNHQKRDYYSNAMRRNGNINNDINGQNSSKPGNNLTVNERNSHVFSSFRDDNINEFIKKLRDEGDAFKDENSWSEIQVLMENSSHQKVSSHWPNLMMNFLLQEKFHQMATSFMDYFQKKEIRPHLAFLTLYISLQACVRNKEEILRAYNMIDTSVLDSGSITRIIQGICLTEKWRESLNLLEMSRVTSADTMSRYGPIIAAAVEHDDVNLAWNLVNECCEKDLAPTSNVYKAFIDNLDEDTLWRFLELIGGHYHYMQTSEARELLSRFERRGFTAKFTKVNRHGQCSACGTRMKKLEITTAEFNALKEHFVQKSVIRGDVFISTTPDELQRFQRFLDKINFDVVIDALNVAHVGKKYDMKIVLKIVELLTRSGKRVLVVSREHTAKDGFMRQLRCPVFYTSNVSKDDPFLLYAALYSGPDCHVITRDEMRDHCHLLGPRHAHIFRNWQRSHQIVVKSGGLGDDPIMKKSRGQGALRLVYPPRHQVVPQTELGRWHVPYDSARERASYELPDTWICAAKR